MLVCLCIRSELRIRMANSEHINRATSASQDMHRRIYGKREDVIREN